jgi:hypothetical protein
MEFNHDVEPEIGKTNKGNKLRLQSETNGIALWMEWQFNGRTVITTGPTQDIIVGSKVNWDRHSRQGVFFTGSHPWSGSFSYKVAFKRKGLHFTFKP